MAALADPISHLSLPQTALPQQESDPRVSDTSDTAEYLVRLHRHVFEMIQSLRISQIKALDFDFLPLEKQLDDVARLAEGWDGYDAPTPSPQAISEAREILERLQDELVKPDWISPSADGGIAFSFASSGNRRAQIEVLNSGEKFAHLYDLNGNSHTEDWVESLEQVPFSELLQPILHYLRA